MQIYVKKLISLHPTKYKYISLEELALRYKGYIGYFWPETFKNNKVPKDIITWLKTEI